MVDEDKYLDAFRTTLPVLIDKEMKKIRRQQRGMTMLLSVLLGVNILMFGAGLWLLTHGNSANTPPASATQEAAAAAALPPVETVDVLADLTDNNEPAEVEAEGRKEEEKELPAERIERSNEAIRRSLDKMRKEAELKQRAADAEEARNARAGNETTPPNAASTSLPAFVVTKSGMTLRSLARRYYGSDLFWVCIYDRNSQALRSPDVLPLGVRLHLPRPDEYGIDANDPSSLRRARAMAQTINY